MEIFFKKTFIKDFKNLSENAKEKVREICLFVFSKANDLKDVKGLDIDKISGFNNYYRIRIGNYRIGFEKQGNSIIFMRVLHRKDIYRFFP